MIDIYVVNMLLQGGPKAASVKDTMYLNEGILQVGYKWDYNLDINWHA